MLCPKLASTAFFILFLNCQLMIKMLGLCLIYECSPNLEKIWVLGSEHWIIRYMRYRIRNSEEIAFWKLPSEKKKKTLTFSDEIPFSWNLPCLGLRCCFLLVVSLTALLAKKMALWTACNESDIPAKAPTGAQTLLQAVRRCCSAGLEKVTREIMLRVGPKCPDKVCKTPFDQVPFYSVMYYLQVRERERGRDGTLQLLDRWAN